MEHDAQDLVAFAPVAPPYTLWALIVYMLQLGTVGFGGPVALVGYMHRDLVLARHWITEAQYKEGIALAQIAPGPLATQLAIYLGYVHYRIRGATLAGLVFVLPSFLMVLAIGWAYVRFGGLPWMHAVFYGVGAAVIGIIAMSAKKLTERSIGRDRLLLVIYVLLAGVTIITKTEIALLFLAAGVVVWLWRYPPGTGAPTSVAAVALLPLPAVLHAVASHKLVQIALFFTKAGAFVFGSGLAIVPFLYGGVVHGHKWLTDAQFVDAVAVAMITPGPVVITVGFIGYLIAGIWGAVVAALGTFLPCYLFTILLAPHMHKYGHRPAVRAFVDGVTAAAVGAITGSVVILGERSIVDVPTAVIAVLTAGLLWKFKKLPEPVIIASAAVFGLILFPLLHR